ncbi:sugar ABC transporter permease [Rhodobacterales bacterium 52_120_T64]|nr:sugar ABC transporter permease [Rhodobacterales bacterium 52_120_T64]
MEFSTIIQILDSAVRLSTPLLLACLAGLYSERSGIFDIGLEGKMLAGAFAAGAMSAYAGMPVTEGGLGMTWGMAWMGVLAAVAVSIVLAMIHGFASITLRGNQLISGVAINFFAAGSTVLIGQHWFRSGGQTPPLSGAQRFGPINLPFADAVKDVPFLGPIYEGLISGHNILVYIAIATVPLTSWLLFRTRFGLRLRAVGENPGAVDTAGISVVRQRYAAVLIAGILCGLAGAYLSLGTSAAGFVKDMSAGKGFIALAALIFAKWRPRAALGACLLFGLLEAIGNRYQSIDLGAFVVPVQFMQALPYILTVVILAGFIGKAIPPAAGGEPYVKER